MTKIKEIDLVLKNKNYINLLLSKYIVLQKSKKLI